MLKSVLIEKTVKRGDELLKADILLGNGECVYLAGIPVNHFNNHPDAAAFVRHTYGMSPAEAFLARSIMLGSLADIKPRPGDMVVYDGSGEYDCMTMVSDEPYGAERAHKAGIGFINGNPMSPDYPDSPDGMLVTFNSYTPFRENGAVDASGGPVPRIKADKLTLIGLREATFKMWYDGYPKADGTGTFKMNVPCWRWDGNAAD
jgi:hypothetical protein